MEDKCGTPGKLACTICCKCRGSDLEVNLFGFGAARTGSQFPFLAAHSLFPCRPVRSDVCNSVFSRRHPQGVSPVLTLPFTSPLVGSSVLSLPPAPFFVPYVHPASLVMAVFVCCFAN